MVKFYNEITKVPIDSINKNNWNPNEEDKQIEESLVDNINQNGFFDAILVQKYNKTLKKNNVIINGEHRFEALKKLGAKEIPVTIIDITDIKAEILSIRLNREHGELNPEKVHKILNDVSPDKDIPFLKMETGIPVKELEVLTKINFEEMTIKEEKTKKQTTEKSVICPNCQHEFKIFK